MPRRAVRKLTPEPLIEWYQAPLADSAGQTLYWGLAWGRQGTYLLEAHYTPSRPRTKWAVRLRLYERVVHEDWARNLELAKRRAYAALQHYERRRDDDGT